MGFRCGIVGLPNVGKSTLFNALTETQAAQAANYPFCTIEPNVGNVGVPDPRLDKLAAIAGSAKIIPTQLGFVDIAGLVRGASKGEGLGNQFLGNIREVDAIVHVLRCFENDDIQHVDNKVDPISDAETVVRDAYVANDTEHDRHNISSNVDDVTLRELYLVPFEHAVRPVEDGGAGVRSLMTSYNRINGAPPPSVGPTAPVLLVTAAPADAVQAAFPRAQAAGAVRSAVVADRPLAFALWWILPPAN